MRKVHEGGNAYRNIGIIILIVFALLNFVSAFIYGIQDNEKWFSRMALGSILLGLFLIADRD